MGGGGALFLEGKLIFIPDYEYSIPDFSIQLLPDISDKVIPLIHHRRNILQSWKKSQCDIILNIPHLSCQFFYFPWYKWVGYNPDPPHNHRINLKNKHYQNQYSIPDL